MNIIEVHNLKKHFGKTHAVNGIDFTIDKGEIFGFLGPNGAGKTTTIRCLMDFIHPSEGKITILGHDAHLESALLKKDIGYLSGNVRLYSNWTGQEHIDFIEGIRGKSTVVKKLIEKLDFNPKIKTKNLSSGNKQKLGLILALMNNPKLIIMDEPTVGLDPLLQNAIYKILEELKKQGTTIFMSSHNLGEVERLCSRVAIIREGKIVALENIHELQSKRLHHLEVHFANKFNKEDFLSSTTTLETEFPDGLTLNVKGDINPLLQQLSKNKVIDLQISHATLEEIFLEFYEHQ